MPYPLPGQPSTLYGTEKSNYFLLSSFLFMSAPPRSIGTQPECKESCSTTLTAQNTTSSVTAIPSPKPPLKLLAKPGPTIGPFKTLKPRTSASIQHNWPFKADYI